MKNLVSENEVKRDDEDHLPQQAHTHAYVPIHICVYTHEHAHIQTAHNTEKEEEQTQEECGLQYLSRLDISKDYPFLGENKTNKGQFSSFHEYKIFLHLC